MPKRRKAGRLANYEFVMKRRLPGGVCCTVGGSFRPVGPFFTATNEITHEFVNNWSYAS